MTRIYLAIGFTIGIIAIISLGWWRYDYIVKDRDQYKTKYEAEAGNLAVEKSNRTKEQKDAADAAVRASQTQTEKENIENEYKAKLACIDDKSCGVRVEFKYKVCPVVPGSATTGVVVNDSDTYGRDFQQWYADTEESIKLDALKIKKLQEDVKVRSAVDYCQPKPKEN